MKCEKCKKDLDTFESKDYIRISLISNYQSQGYLDSFVKKELYYCNECIPKDFKEICQCK